MRSERKPTPAGKFDVPNEPMIEQMFDPAVGSLA
jgi:hypothetical protein